MIPFISVYVSLSQCHWYLWKHFQISKNILFICLRRNFKNQNNFNFQKIKIKRFMGPKSKFVNKMIGLLYMNQEKTWIHYELVAWKSKHLSLINLMAVWESDSTRISFTSFSATVLTPTPLSKFTIMYAWLLMYSSHKDNIFAEFAIPLVVEIVLYKQNIREIKTISMYLNWMS